MVDFDYINENGKVTIVLRGYLTISEVPELKEIFNKSIAESENITIKHENNEGFDLAYIQLVLAAYRTAKEWRKNFKVICRENDPFKRIFNEIGFKVEELFLN